MNASSPATERRKLPDGTEVDIVMGRMVTDSHLPDHWKIAVYRHSSTLGAPLIESYPLPPETQYLELEAVADELLAELEGAS